jgi:hypothetical protein
VLRITLPTRDDPPVFVLEGRLVGDWVKELMRVTRDLKPGTKSIFDIEEVSYVDMLGEEALRWLNRMGATFIVWNAYGKDVCHRLHLRRATAAFARSLISIKHMGKKARTRTAPTSSSPTPP